MALTSKVLCKITKVIEQKGMTFDQDFSYSFPFFFPPKIEGRRKGEWISKTRDKRSCLSARSTKVIKKIEKTLYILLI